MKGIQFKVAYDVVTLTILFESSPKWFLHFHKGPHIKHLLPAEMRLLIQLYPY